MVGGGGGGTQWRGGLINFAPLKRGGLLEGGLNRGFTVRVYQEDKLKWLFLSFSRKK